MIFKMTLSSVGEHQVGLSPTATLGRRKSNPLYLPTPVAHKIYGIPQTINSANYVYFLAMNELYQLEPGSLFTMVWNVVINAEGSQNSITLIAPSSSSSQARSP